MSALDNFLKSKRAELSELKKKRRNATGTGKTGLSNPIKSLEALIRRFRKSNMEPGRVGNIVVNYKLYTRFMKKLKGFHTETVVTNESLTVHYGKVRGKWTGKLVLLDLTSYFEGHGEIPKVEINE